MSKNQREPNPDVNTFNVNSESNTTEQAEIEHDQNPGIEQRENDDVIPVPPDAQPVAPIEEPPGTGGPPVGDVNDSPKQIAKE